MYDYVRPLARETYLLDLRHGVLDVMGAKLDDLRQHLALDVRKRNLPYMLVIVVLWLGRNMGGRDDLEDVSWRGGESMQKKWVFLSPSGSMVLTSSDRRQMLMST